MLLNTSQYTITVEQFWRYSWPSVYFLFAIELTCRCG